MAVAGLFDWVSDAWDATGGRVFSVAEDVFEGLPIYEPMRDLVNGPLRDFARTGVGRVVLRALATNVTGAFAWTLGPQLATIFWAMPGLARGDTFEEAWISEFKWRAEKTAEIVGPGVLEAIGAQMWHLLDAFGAQVGVGNLVTWTAKEIARRFNVREDVAAYARALWNRTLGDLAGVDFDPHTGEMVTRAGYSVFDPTQLRTGVEGRAATSLALASAASPWHNVSTSFYSDAMPSSAPTPAPVASPPPVAAGAPTSERKTAGDVALVLLVAGAAGALVWFFAWEKKRA